MDGSGNSKEGGQLTDVELEIRVKRIRDEYPSCQYATPMADDMLCSICGQLLVHVHENQGLCRCRFCSSCLDRIVRARNMCIHSSPMTKDMIKTTINQLALKTILVDCGNGSRSLYSLYHLIVRIPRVVNETEKERSSYCIQGVSKNYDPRIKTSSATDTRRTSADKGIIKPTEKVTTEEFNKLKENSKTKCDEMDTQISQEKDKQDKTKSDVDNCKQRITTIKN